MPGRLTDLRAEDGSRHFLSIPEVVGPEDLRDLLAGLPGAVITDFLTDLVTEAWIDFSYRGHTFSVNNQQGEYWFFVEDPTCPDGTLEAIASCCEPVANRPAPTPRTLGSERPVDLGAPPRTVQGPEPPRSHDGPDRLDFFFTEECEVCGGRAGWDGEVIEMLNRIFVSMWCTRCGHGFNQYYGALQDRLRNDPPAFTPGRDASAG